MWARTDLKTASQEPARRSIRAVTLLPLAKGRPFVSPMTRPLALGGVALERDFSRVPVHSVDGAGGPADAGVLTDAGVIPDAGVPAGVADAGTANPPTFVWPLPSTYARVLSGFSVRKDPLDPEAKKTESHLGMDIPAPEGTDIYAAAAGTARVRSQTDTEGNLVGYGNYVTVAHDAVWSTRYAHCSEFVAEDGAVKQGELIAKVGKTGRVTGPHLHFEVLKNGTQQDPAKYVSATAK